MGAEMQALDDFRELRQHLRSAQIAHTVMRGDFTPLRRAQAASAHSRALDRIFEALDRLDRQPLNGAPGAVSTMVTLEGLLVTITNADNALARL